MKRIVSIVILLAEGVFGCATQPAATRRGEQIATVKTARSSPVTRAATRRSALRTPVRGTFTRREATHPAPTQFLCPRVKRPGHPKIYLLGSSTMGGLLGTMLRREFKRWGVRALLFGKASSGLARPDFFSWPKKIRKINRRSDPDVYVVALGTNDFQVMRIYTRKRRWLRTTHREWLPRYARRVDELLHVMSGPKRERTVIYIGPNAFHRKNAVRMAPRLTKLIRARIAAFDGPAYYVDAVTPLLTSRGRVIKHMRHPKTKRRMKVFMGDGIHLNPRGCRWIMAEPVYRLLRPCFEVARRGPLPRRSRITEARAERRVSAIPSAP